MPSIPIAEFKDAILRKYQAKARAKKTTNQIKQVLREITALEISETGQFTDGMIDRWLLAWPDRTPVTFKSHLRCFSAMCTIAKKNGWIEVDPFADEAVSSWMRDDARPSPPKRRFSKPQDDVKRIYALAKNEAETGSWDAWRRFVLLSLNILTGARVGELTRLEWTDFDRTAQTLTVAAKWVTDSRGKKYWWKPKTFGSAGKIAIGDALTETLCLWEIRVRRPYRRQFRFCPYIVCGKQMLGPWVGGGPGRSPLDEMKALGNRAGVEGFTNKAGRKGLGTAKDLLTPAERRSLFRHADENVGDNYDDEQVESMRPAVIRIEKYFLTGT